MANLNWANLNWHRTGVILAAALTLSTTAAASGISREFQVSDGGKLVVEAERAELEIRGSDSDQVRVSISRGDDDAAEIEEDYSIEFSQAGEVVTLDVKTRRKCTSWFTRSLTIDVELPDRFDVDLKTSGGNVDVSHLTGVIGVSTSGGDLIFEEVDGPIHGRTSGGSIELDGTSADVDVKTSGGTIRIGNVEGTVQARTSGGNILIDQVGGTVVARTSGGRIEVGEVQGSIDATTSGGNIKAGISAQPSADSKLRTSGGSVTVYLSPAIAVALDASTSGGGVHSDFPVQLRGQATSNRLTGDLNGGGPILQLRSSGGSVNIRTR